MRVPIIIGLIVILILSVLDPNFWARTIGMVESVSITVLAWVAIAYLLKRM
jgi:hypothetical protein